MSEILLASANDPKMSQQILHSMFGLRHKVFHERLGWKVSSQQGMERDSYDELNPLYIVANTENNVVEGCWRILPTTGPYMLKDTFPELLCGEPVPEDPRIWELSRFAVAPEGDDSNNQVTVHPVTFALLRSAFRYAEENNIEQYVTVTSVAVERLLKRLGLPLKRFGHQKATRVGKVLSVACKIDINQETRKVLFPEQETWNAAA